MTAEDSPTKDACQYQPIFKEAAIEWNWLARSSGKKSLNVIRLYFDYLLVEIA